MHRQDTRGHDTPDTATESGLSTDDLARPHDRATEDTSGPPPDAPMFPGESTATPSDAPEREDDAGFDGTGREGTGRADTGREGARGAEDTGRAGSGRDTGGSRDAQDADDTPQLLSPQDEEAFRARWQEAQSQFVDDPRDAVHTADALVADVMQRLAATFADHKQELEGQWNRGEQADTENLRLALRHYRSFFNRLLVT
ncbi:MULTISPECIES: hypothetical protein [unclassified Streptomyces]|uniref:hypothetical protein n=1 Tax=unclassified Streptomyces TaxID=2593676 RepID=UPI00143E5DA4|nr:MULTISPECIES: hypothetical protein [unclassified Streptomyces]QIY63004.1 hypothetical protein HEP85_16865 [Streptomyces sp. RPA4-2]